ncbi:hypothetical protein ACIA8G_21730 [Lentzea sp. NPDC051213]|uniref:hypothetical protein n=1 Tax=Lentzea sp. NPDC051213 TaxID=3364126 RepID=UPI0037926513
MTTTDEIQRRVEKADADRSARRSAAAQQVGVLAQRRAAIAEQLGDIERELGDVLAAASDVIDIDELARFTDVPAADLTRWRAAHKTARTKRKRHAAATEVGTSREPAAAKTSAADQGSTLPDPTVSGATTADAPARTTVGVT